MDGDACLVGAPFANHAGTNSGAAYLGVSGKSNAVDVMVQ